MTKLRELPKDLVEEILCHVPATNLERLRSTCKRWNRLFKYDWRFARKHLEIAPKKFLALMFTKNNILCPMSINLHGVVPSVEVRNELSLFDPDSSNSAQLDTYLTQILYNVSYQLNISRVFHCDGLLLCTSKDESRIVVWNPCTGQTKWMDTGKRGKKGRAFVLGYYQDNKSCTKTYKILSFYTCSNDLEIYEFSSDSWRTLDHDIAPAGCSLPYFDHWVSLKGDTYVFGTNETTTQIGGLSLLRFDFSTEKFVPVPFPCKQRRGYKAACLSVVKEEKISMLLQHDDSSNTDIWLTNKIDETKVVSWSKVLALNLSGFDILTSFLLDEEKKAVVLCEIRICVKEKRRDMVYIIEEDNKVTPVDLVLHEMNSGWPVILNYVPSLVQIERARSKRKRAD